MERGVPVWREIQIDLNDSIYSHKDIFPLQFYYPNTLTPMITGLSSYRQYSSLWNILHCPNVASIYTIARNTIITPTVHHKQLVFILLLPLFLAITD